MTFEEYRNLSKEERKRLRMSLTNEEGEVFDAVLDVLDTYKTGGTIGPLGAEIVNAVLTRGEWQKRE